ncbi:MAG: hypothetical protein U1E61_11050 [Bradyrhizobium sp.]
MTLSREIDSSDAWQVRVWTPYFTALVLTIMVVLIATASVNYFVDVQDVYGRRNEILLAYYRNYVRHLIRSERPLTYIVHERAMKQELARQTQSDCYVFGSSHEMRVNIWTYPVARQLGCKDVTNLAVSAASFEDLLVMTSLIFDKPTVKTFLIGIGPWALRPNANSFWTEPPDVLPPARRALGLSDETENTLLIKMRQLVNGRYLWANLNQLYAPDLQIQAPTFRERDQAIFGSFDPDGTYNYASLRPDGVTPYSDRLAPGTPVDDGSWGIEKPFVDPGLMRELEHVLALLKQRGIQVAIVLNPYHPYVWTCASAITCDALRTVEPVLRDLAHRMGLPIVGSYDPNVFGFKETDFRDDAHLSRDELHRVGFTN